MDLTNKDGVPASPAQGTGKSLPTEQSSAQERFGLIGAGIAQSLSPRLFGAAYGEEYSYDLLDGPDFLPLWKRFLEAYRAANVTAPYKEDAFAQVLGLARDGLGGISGPCFKIGATNLVVKTPDGIMAHNSDFTGIILSVAEAYFPDLTATCYAHFGDRAPVKVHQFLRNELPGLFGRRPQALVIGCGGAGKAAAVAAAEMGFATALMNRTHEKAQEFAARLPEYGFIAVPTSDLRGALKECDLVIYTPPEPMEALETLTAEDFAGEQDGFPGAPGKVLLEANYKTPAFSGALLDRLREGGCRYVSGRRWILYQALAGYGLMTGRAADFSAMENILA